MNLNEPCFDSVLAIDAQLQKLQAEVANMNSEFANYQQPRLRMQQYNAASTPSPEIEEERKANKVPIKPKVTFKDDAASARDILRGQQKKTTQNEGNLQEQYMQDLSH
jgi:hypothetical protein